VFIPVCEGNAVLSRLGPVLRSGPYSVGPGYTRPVPVTLPYARLNLRRNPFGELGPEERAAIAVVEADGLAERLQKPGLAVQILGGCGCGKTTWLLALLRGFPGAPFVKVVEGVRTALPAGHPLFVDDAHLLPPTRRRRLFGRRASFVLTTHVDLAAEIERCGLAAFTVRPAETQDVERLERAFALRVEAARRDSGPLPRVPRAMVEELVRRFGSDVRSMEHCLYHAFVTLGGVRDVEV